jgi:glycolate oxidase
LPPGELVFTPETLTAHAGDKWFASHPPEAVALPKSVESVSRILAFATAHRIPVTPRGAGHGYVGGCVPVQGGLALSVAGMDRIVEISARDFVTVVQPGVKTARL